MRARERHQVLRRLGFVLIRSRGVHDVYQHPEKGTQAIVSRCSKDYDKRGWLNERARLRREGFDL
jgi:predicted RNA binding protein YcfA (HicA-like mRNA interferase family)